MLPGTGWDCWSVPVQGQELEFNDHYGSLPIQDILWVYGSMKSCNMQQDILGSI